jgi:magnesium chelatase family protein
MAELRASVERARLAQQKRKGSALCYTNHELTSKEVEQLVALEPDAGAIIKSLFERSIISARGYYRTLKVARTIADLAGRELVSKEDVSEAFSYRLRDGMVT